MDDEEVFAQALKLWLDARERIEVAHDGPEAIDLALFNDAQVVLMDIGQPKFDGLEATPPIAQADVRVIALTGQSADDGED